MKYPINTYYLADVSDPFPEVASMKVFLRSPIWVTPSIGARFAGPDGTNFACEIAD
jgi:hypothetical protein